MAETRLVISHSSEKHISILELRKTYLSDYGRVVPYHGSQKTLLKDFPTRDISIMQNTLLKLLPENTQLSEMKDRASVSIVLNEEISYSDILKGLESEGWKCSYAEKCSNS